MRCWMLFSPAHPRDGAVAVDAKRVGVDVIRRPRRLSDRTTRGAAEIRAPAEELSRRGCSSCSHFAKRFLMRGPSSKLKECRFTSTWYDPCNGCTKNHVHVPKRLVCDGESKLPWHAADTLHWLLNSLGIYLLIPAVRAELCKSYSTMDPAVYSYVLLVEILGRLCAYRFDRVNELPQLEAAVRTALGAYVAVPEYVLLVTKAKLFFCGHTILFILLCGPLRLWWCMRLEGKHQPLKALAVRCNFKNVPLSIVHGAMRTLAYSYSTSKQDCRAPVHCRGRRLQHGLGLTESPVVSLAQVASILSANPSLSPQAAAYYVTHWENVSCSRGGVYQRLDTAAMLVRGTGVYLCMVMGAVAVDDAIANPGRTESASWTAVSLHVLQPPISVAAHGVWTLGWQVTQVQSLLRALAGHSVLLSLPLRTYHSDTDLVPVVVCPSPQRPDAECVVIPRHSGFA